MNAEVAIGFGELRAELALYGGEIGERLLTGHTGPEAADDIEPCGAAVLCIGGIRCIDGKEVDSAIGEGEGCGHDADDGKGAVGEVKQFADDIGIGVEAAMPKAVADDHDIRAAEVLFSGREVAA
jgi:hypothetical protein